MFLIPAVVFSQEQLGLRLDRFAGLSGAAINPAGLALMPMKWDAQLAGAAVFFGNDYAFLENTSLPKIYRGLQDSTFSLHVTSFGSGAEPPRSGETVLNFYERKSRLFGAARLLGMLPGAALHLGERWTAGVSASFRGDLMTHTVPVSLAYPPYDRIKFGNEFSLGQMVGAGMMWSSIDLHAAHLVETDAGFLAFGLNFKFLQGFEAAFARANSSFFLTKQSGDSLFFRGAQFEGGVTTSNFESIASSGKTPPSLQKNGRGFGGDFGVVFAAPWENGNDPSLKIGFSILDIGRVRFSKNAERHVFEQDSTVLIDAQLYAASTDPRQALDLTSEQFYGSPTDSKRGSNFSIGLPLALSLQADWQFLPRFFVAGAIVQRLHWFNTSLQRPNILAAAPRWESRWLSFSMPFSFENYRRFRVGASARLGFLTVGTDYLQPFFGQKRLTGFDFYVALKINAFKNWGDDARRIVRLGRRDRVRCYQF